MRLSLTLSTPPGSPPGPLSLGPAARLLSAAVNRAVGLVAAVVHLVPWPCDPTAPSSPAAAGEVIDLRNVIDLREYVG